LRMAPSQTVAENLPPALAATLPSLPGLKWGEAFAVLCSGFSCQPPIRESAALQRALQTALQGKV
jgi:uncharacterized protein